jgi:hypothetical protein
MNSGADRYYLVVGMVRNRAFNTKLPQHRLSRSVLDASLVVLQVFLSSGTYADGLNRNLKFMAVELLASIKQWGFLVKSSSK